MSSYSEQMQRVLGLLPENKVADAVTGVEMDIYHLHNNAIPAITHAVQDDALSADDLALVLPLFRPWEPDEVLAVGSVRRHNGALYETVQAHTTQAEWEPQMVPALFKLHAPAGFMLPWVMPTGGHDSPNLNDERTHNGKCWRSLIDGNITEPSDTAQWWEEIEC